LVGGEAMNYQFAKENITQHIIKYGVHVQPGLSPRQDKAKLQDYCNWLIEGFPLVFETLLVGPNQLRVQKSFLLANNKRAELPTFMLTARGPVFTMPQRLFIDEPQDLHIPERDKIFRKALDELKSRFVEQRVMRVGVVHEIVFDTGTVDSVEIVSSSFKNDVWRERAKNLRILLETPQEDKNVNLEIKPTYLKRAARGGAEVVTENKRFGIIVNVDINNRQVRDDLSRADISDVLAFANDYVPEELIRFLNNEY
jgi:hypothetical protein